jgi:hypothetical protein
MDEIIHLKIPTVDGPHPVLVLTLLEGDPGEHFVSIRWGDTKGPDLVLLLDEVHVIRWEEFKALALTLGNAITLPRERT